MTAYLVRVELFGAGPNDYESLHESMKSKGFTREVSYETGEIQKLPIGTYVGYSHLSAVGVRDEVMAISSPFSTKTASIFVCDYNNWAAHLYN